MDVKLLISDFDGILVDTFEANFRAYCDAFAIHNMVLTRDMYRACFGLRFDRFMDCMGVEESTLYKSIRDAKAEAYPRYFNYLQINNSLLGFIRSFHKAGGKTAIASTAREKNLLKVLEFIGVERDFDIVLAGESVVHGKPNPEIYKTVLRLADCCAEEALVFEDSDVGVEAARAAGISCISITKDFFENGN